MLSVYTRHAQNCDHRDDINWRRCRCPKWIQGVGADGRGQIRITAKTRSWEQAEAKARQMDQAADPTKPKIKSAVTIAEAVSNFRADEDGRCLQKTTIAQSKTLFEGLLLNWAKQRGLILLTELTTPELTKFRASWGNGPNTTRRKHERLVGFFNFCIANDWIEKNPAARMKRVEEKRVPTDYFTRQEFERIVDATCAYGDWQGGHDFHSRQRRLLALVLLMRWSGLAIKDAVTLERERLASDGRLFLYRAKTGVPVYVPLPVYVVEMLHALPNSNPRYFFWSGNGDTETAKKGWQRTLRHFFKNFAKIVKPDGTPKRCHPHMFRDTFAVELLLSGVPIDQVSLLLGHSSVKITEKHYAPFVKARQEQLESSVKLSWQAQADWQSRHQQAPQESVADLLRQHVEAHHNILISGGTGTGKTTLLNILTGFIPNEDRIILLEDTAEIGIKKPNLVRFEARKEQNGIPPITIRDLLKASLRHRPDRIIVGEIRGGEAFDLLQALNTGHSGTLSTIHANSAAQALQRFTSCVLQSGVELPYRAIKSHIADSIQLLVHIERQHGNRLVSQILEIQGYTIEADKYEFKMLFEEQIQNS